MAAFEARLQQRGARLDIVRGEADREILAIAARGASRVLWTRRYDGAARSIDANVKMALRERGVEAVSFNGRLLREPWELAASNGKPAGVFSAFWRRHQGLGPLTAPGPLPSRLASAPWPREAPRRVSIESLRLTPSAPGWSAELVLDEIPGEGGGIEALSAFVVNRLATYADARDSLDHDGTSRLSAHLRFGEVSVRRAAQAVEDAAARTPSLKSFRGQVPVRAGLAGVLLRAPLRPSRSCHAAIAAGVRAFSVPRRRGRVSRLGARGDGLSCGRRRNAPALADRNDAQSGAHGRGLLLVKHLLIDWRRGEQWFWDTLCDADPASNPASWQWVAGCGADAAPYFRVFNPVLQGARFDPDGGYVRRWVPELARLAAPYVHSPWTAPEDILAGAGVVLGKTYPRPIVEHAGARARALAAFGRMRSEGPSA